MAELFETPGFREQLQADRTTLETMIEDQKKFIAQLSLEGGDPLGFKEARMTVRAMHETYIGALEDALATLSSLAEF